MCLGFIWSYFYQIKLAVVKVQEEETCKFPLPVAEVSMEVPRARQHRHLYFMNV